LPVSLCDEGLWPAFIQHTKADLDDLACIIATRNLSALRRWMHRMRGALLVLKCKSMAARCHDIEMRCRATRQWNEKLAGSAHDIADQLRALVALCALHFGSR
jgi:HPt (histidine-containing phosphotransfer) domain-containing protein